MASNRIVFNNTGLENPSTELIYEKMNEKIEKLADMINFAMIIVTLLGMMMPNLIISYFMYFTTDLSSDAFHLAFPIW